jgi:hypothetical protein
VVTEHNAAKNYSAAAKRLVRAVNLVHVAYPQIHALTDDLRTAAVEAIEALEEAQVTVDQLRKDLASLDRRHRNLRLNDLKHQLKLGRKLAAKERRLVSRSTLGKYEHIEV